MSQRSVSYKNRKFTQLASEFFPAYSAFKLQFTVHLLMSNQFYKTIKIPVNLTQRLCLCELTLTHLVSA
jgi:hypothetical protein